MVARVIAADDGSGRGIPFTGPMVLALFDGRKTRTRRLVTPQPCDGIVVCPDVFDGSGAPDPRGGFLIDRTKHATAEQPRPPYAAGDRLWLKETWRLPAEFDQMSWEVAAGRFIAEGAAPADLAELVPVIYCADGARSAAWRPDMRPGRRRVPRYMPRALSRAFINVSAMRFERVQDITEAEARAEGVTFGPEVQGVTHGIDGEPLRTWFYADPPAELEHALTARQAFEKLWGTLHGDLETGWAANPWVAVYSIETIKKNIDT